jgi:hypothetical protein
MLVVALLNSLIVYLDPPHLWYNFLKFSVGGRSEEQI